MSSGSDDELDTQQPQGLTQAANTGLMDFIANEVRLNPMVLSKSQLPHVKRKKDEAVENIIKKHENHFGRRIEISRLMKKINNMKTRLKKKTDWSKTGNKRIKLQNWEKLLYEAMEGNVNPCVSQMPGGLACGVANTSSASESPTLISESISTASSDTSMHSSQLIIESITSPRSDELSAPSRLLPRGNKYDFNETSETKSLTNTELQRLVLLEQLQTARAQREYYKNKLKVLKTPAQRSSVLEPGIR